MPHEPQTFTIVDPREMDGDVYEVADRAARQLEGVIAHATAMVDGAKLMARNAELERQLSRGEDADAIGWPDTPAGKKWDEVDKRLETLLRLVQILRRAASYNPKQSLSA